MITFVVNNISFESVGKYTGILLPLLLTVPENIPESFKNSLLAPPIEDANDRGKLYSNVGHNSGAFDGIKLGGVRMNYGIICGEDNSRCETDEQGNLKQRIFK